MSLATLLSQEHQVTVVDKDESRVEKILSRQSTVEDALIQDYLKNKNLKLNATSMPANGIIGCDFIILALPTNFNESLNKLDTTVIEGVIRDISLINPNVPILIKSTIPIGFSNKVNDEHPNEIIFSPEFLREGQALHDNLYPSRIIMGSTSSIARDIADIFKKISLNSPDIFLMKNEEAESVKLFANSYLALRVAFFNELDSYCMSKNLDAESIIRGVSADGRIGNHYNNPSFGYGGYCLPKDTKQLLSSFNKIPQNIFSSIVDSNKTRKEFLFNQILKAEPNVIGIYRLTMKAGSDNIRESAIIDVLNKLKNSNIPIVIFEPIIAQKSFMGIPVITSLQQFLDQCDLILTNRRDKQIMRFKGKIFTRDLFGNN